LSIQGKPLVDADRQVVTGKEAIREGSITLSLQVDFGRAIAVRQVVFDTGVSTGEYPRATRSRPAPMA